MLYSELSDKQIDDYRWMRWKARTDLIWLCNNLLEMPDVSRELNGTLVDRLQQFPKPESPEQMARHDRFDKKNGWVYTPLIYDRSKRRERLPDPSHPAMGKHRRRLIIDSRGTMKTAINVIAHTIQCILNYPDIGIGIFQSSKPKAITVVKGVKEMFQFKPDLRALFPELCPAHDEIDGWGTTEQFVCPGRTSGYVRMEPTVKALSLETKMAGMHFEWLKFTDVVELDNSRNEEMRKAVITAFDNSERILVGSQYWIDVEGTMWHFGDLYNEIIGREKKRQAIKNVYMVGDVPLLDRTEAEESAKLLKKKVVEYQNFYVPQPDKRMWQVYINCIFKRDAPNPTYDYDDMIRAEIHPDTQAISFKFANGSKAPVVFSENGTPVSRWETRHPGWKMLEDLKTKPTEFNFQMMNYPTAGMDGVQEFPINEKEGFPMIIPRKVFRERIRIASYDAAIDIADTSGRRSDFSCITVGAFDAYGRCYIVKILHGKWPHSELIKHLFEVQNEYQPQRIMLERGPGANSFLQYLQREMELQKVWLNIVRVPRGSNLSKQQRISQTLQPYYQNKELLFLDDLGQPYEFLKAELQQWPSPRHDDILDTISDLFYERTRYGRQLPRLSFTPRDLLAQDEEERARRLAYALEQAKSKALDRLLEGPPQVEDVHSYYRLTGGF